MTTRRNNPLALTADQIEDRAMEGSIRLNAYQVRHLQDHGLNTDSQNWYYSPDGSFALAPIHADARSLQRRKRIYLAPVTSIRAA